MADDSLVGDGLPEEHLRVTVFHEDDEARALWREVTGLPDARIYGLGAKDNFWQMADTGPCGPCTEIYVDLAHLAQDWRFPAGASGEATPGETPVTSCGRCRQVLNELAQLAQTDPQIDCLLRTAAAFAM